jgi:hypothetical protein
MNAEKLVLPGEQNVAKLPLPIDPTANGSVPPELKAAWTQSMINGFRQNEQMFQNTLNAFLRPYRLTVWLYAVLSVVGLGLFILAAVLGLQRGEAVTAMVFAGLSVGTFIGIFLRQPLQALEGKSRIYYLAWGDVQYLLDTSDAHAGSHDGSNRSQGGRGRFPHIHRILDHQARRSEGETARHQLIAHRGKVET